MRMFSVFQRHARFARDVDAYIDGALAGPRIDAFEMHLAGCRRCAEAVDSGREVKAGLARLPQVEAPRSFRLTAAMVASARPPRSRGVGTPLYVGLVRAGAAVSVAAFATVFAFTSLDSTGGGDDDDGGASLQMDAGSPAQYESQSLAEDKAAATPAAQDRSPQIAPPNTAQAAGSGVATPTVESAPRASDSSSPGAAPQPGNVVPATGGETAGENTSAIGYDATTPRDDEGSEGLIFVLGAVAGGFVLLAAGIEITRRVRRA